MNDCFIAFWSGMAGGVAVGIVITAILIAIGNSIEGKDQDHDEML